MVIFNGLFSWNSSLERNKQTKQNKELNEHTWIEQSCVEELLDHHALF
jgi:hypothetical protein